MDGEIHTHGEVGLDYFTIIVPDRSSINAIKSNIHDDDAFVNVPPNIWHSFKNKTNEIAKLIIVLSPAGMKQLFIEVGLEIANTNLKPAPFSNEQIQKLARLAPKYGMEIKPPT